jgi:tetratricopeptide (TPR) repeat protein
MADEIDTRDFFISFNSADLAYAEAINSALKTAGFTTYYHPTDIRPGGNIPKWMDHALKHSRQLLMLCSPEYLADGAVYSEAERYAAFWQDTREKMVPVELRKAEFTPLLAMFKRVDAKNRTPAEAAVAVVEALRAPEEIEERKVLDKVQPARRIFNVLYRPNANFAGRSETMDALEKSLRDGNAAVTAVHGLGGVGKTTLAAEYCHRFGGRYGGVWWVRAEQEPVMLADLAALGPRLGLAASGNIEADVRAVLENLAGRNEPWLMVYDNAPNPDAVAKWLPAGAVRCIITSRFAGFDAIAAVTALDQWSDTVTADYLLARTGRTDRDGALRLAHALGGLPLAAEQAAVHLRPRAGTSFDDYAADIVALIRRPRPKGAAGDYPDTVYAAFVKSLETLKFMEGGNTALDILRLCAFLSPDGVELELLMAYEDGQALPSSFTKAIADKTTREDALAALISLSLLRRENGPFGPVLIFHRLLLEVVRDWMGADARRAWGSAAVRLVSRPFPYDADDPSQWPLCARLMPHLSPFDAQGRRTGAAGKALDRLLNQAGIYLYTRGDRAGALALAEKSVALMRMTQTDEPLSLATGLSNLAGRYIDLGRLDEGEAAAREALAIEEPLLNSNDPSLAITLSNLAEVHWKRKQFAQAEPLLLRAAEITKAALGENSADYGKWLSNLGAVYGRWAEETDQTTKRTQEEKFKTDALAVTRAARGARHPETAISYSNLAVMKHRRGNWPGAAEAMERAAAIMLSLDLAQHPDTLGRAAVLAFLWQRSGQPDKAFRLTAGDMSDLLPVIAQIEAEHRAWVAEDPEHRHFGPPSPFANLAMVPPSGRDHKARHKPRKKPRKNPLRKSK